MRWWTYAWLLGVASLSAEPPQSWERWSAREELAPQAEYLKESATWKITSGNRPMRHGGWDLHWPEAKPGQWYRFDVDCHAQEIESIHDNAHAELIFWKNEEKRADWQHVGFRKLKDGRIRFSVTAQMPTNAVKATARVMLRWAGKGELRWTNPNLETVNAPAARKLKTAIITGRPPGASVDANLDFTEQLIRRAAKAGAEVVCLPEVITTWRIKDDAKNVASPIPGPVTKRLEKIARELKIDINLSMHEIDEDGLVYNTAVYLDPKQGIVGKYRKVHLAVGERWKGITPGSEFPVWKTRYGKAGMLICYDNVHPEGHRILSQKGAEVIFLPIMGDPRAVGNRAYEKWLQIMSVRAMDNHVWMVVCQNNGDRGVIIRPDGELIKEVDPGDGFAMAEIDLNFRHDSWIGSDFLNRNWGERRPTLYRDLVKDR